MLLDFWPLLPVLFNLTLEPFLAVLLPLLVHPVIDRLEIIYFAFVSINGHIERERERRR